MKHLPTDPEARYNNQNVPWQRVINAKGEISPRFVYLFLYPTSSNKLALSAFTLEYALYAFSYYIENPLDSSHIDDSFERLGEN